jgi:integrase
VKDPFVLKYCANKITDFYERLNKVDTNNWSVKDVVQYLDHGTADVCFSDYARQYHDEMYRNGQRRNARNYELAYQHLERYAGTTKVMFSHLTSMFINGWIKSMSSTARAKEMYPVCVRQIFKQALIDYNDYDTGILRITTNPWPKVKIPKADTPEKKAISMEDCRKFFAAPLPESDRKYPLSELGRDVAMMILCLAGINTIDIFYLRKQDYKHGIISYERRKTRKARADNAYIEMRVPDILKPTMEKYLDKTDSEYLLNFHQRMTTSDSFNANVNIGIRQICEKSLGIPHDDAYCAYTFRHTWATVAQNNCGASESEVGFAMNHSQHKTTRGYIRKVDFTPAWKLNEKVVEKIFFTDEKSNDYQEEEQRFERFSAKYLIRGTAYFMGKVVAKVEDIGFNNVDEVIDKLMGEIEGIPERSTIQIKIENVDKEQTQLYERQIRH